MYPDGMSAYAALLMKQLMDKQFASEEYDEAKEKRRARRNRVIDTFLMSVVVMFVVAVMI